MFRAPLFVHGNRERLPEQELALDAAVHLMRDAALQAFATKVDALIWRALTYRAAAREHRKNELAKMLDCSSAGLLRLYETVADYENLDEEDLYRIAVMGSLTGSLSLREVEVVIEEEHKFLRILDPRGSFGRAVRDWTRRQDSGQLPPCEYVVYHVYGNLGAFITKDTLPEIACRLAYAFDEASMPVSLAENIVASYGHRQLTHRLIYEIAKEALVQADRRRQAGATDSTALADAISGDPISVYAASSAE